MATSEALSAGYKVVVMWKLSFFMTFGQNLIGEVMRFLLSV